MAKANDQLITIMVEGKASELFGDLVKDCLRDTSPGKQARLDFLSSQLELDQNCILEIRYQFLHRTVSALIVAQDFRASIALMLVHSFSPNHNGFDDYKRFVGLFGIEAEMNQIYKANRFNCIDLDISWVSDHNEYGAEASDLPWKIFLEILHLNHLIF